MTFKKDVIPIVYYLHIIEISTNKGANSYKLKILKKANYKSDALNYCAKVPLIIRTIEDLMSLYLGLFINTV